MVCIEQDVYVVASVPCLRSSCCLNRSSRVSKPILKCRSTVHQISHLSWLSPELLKLIGHSQVDSDPDHICVFDRLLDLDVLIGEDLHLLAIIPKR